HHLLEGLHQRPPDDPVPVHEPREIGRRRAAAQLDALQPLGRVEDAACRVAQGDGRGHGSAWRSFTIPGVRPALRCLPGGIEMADSKGSVVFWHSPNTRSTGARILLEELGAPHEMRVLDMKAGEQRKAPYLAVNPLGKVPAIVHDGALVTEQG